MSVQLSVEPNDRLGLRYAYEDEHLLVVDKPAGVVTQPGRKHSRDTLLNAAFATHGKTLQNIGKARDYGLVHRLDRPTSGLVVVALTQESYDHLRGQFAERTVHKTYLALVHGAPNPPKGVERSPIREIRRGGRKRAALGDGRGAQPAETRYAVLVRARGVSLVECAPRSGRLHQIRVHLAHRGCPVIGDDEYGRRDGLDRALGKHRIGLHAARLALTHPATGKRLVVQSPVPDDLLAVFERLGLACPRAWR